MTIRLITISETSPASASTVVGTTYGGLGIFSALHIDANLLGGTGGVLDVYLQRKIADDIWVDWCHFTQAAAATAVRRSFYCSNGFVNPDAVSSEAVGFGTNSTPSVALAAAKFIGGHPGDAIRTVYVAGASTSAGAAQKIYITGFLP